MVNPNPRGTIPSGAEQPGPSSGLSAQNTFVMEKQHLPLSRAPPGVRRNGRVRDKVFELEEGRGQLCGGQLMKTQGGEMAALEITCLRQRREEGSCAEDSLRKHRAVKSLR